MKIHFRLFIKIFLVSIFTLSYPGCITDKTHIGQNTPPSQEKVIENNVDNEPSPTESDEANASLSRAESAQDTLDTALEFCQASNDFWEEGDLENAIDALDKAYSLILKVDSSEAGPEILQQREDLRFTISKRIIEVYSSRFTVVNGNHNAIPLVMNSHVEKALALFKGKERQFFLDSYRRSGRYRPAIVKAFREAGLPEELSWLPFIESGFKVRALSKARALGLWQFIASTGYKFGLKRDQWVDERMDPKKATKAAIAYLTELHQIFGDWTTALAAYNCGEGRVLRYIKSQKINYLDDFWDLYGKLPRETAFYVPKFLALLHIINDPLAYGFTLPEVDKEVKFEVVTIEKQVNLKTVADHLKITYAVLKDLNAELRHKCTPKRAYSFKVPVGKGDVLFSKLDDIPVWSPPVPAYVLHRVRRGETLSGLAMRYKTSVRAIKSLNGLRSSRYIKAGWKLKIPTRGTSYASSTKRPSQVIIPKEKGKPVQYMVRRGDSLWRIARRFGTTTKEIKSINRIKGTHLNIGQVLLVPVDSKFAKDIKTGTYTVQKGDSPYLIAQQYRMSLSEFLRINHLTPRSTIFPGQVLLVKAE
ncbi:MAG: LysM peptidoglycan-binding domain-containing protein [Desulfobacterales bacterium]|nr:LysM peptidoglycan-binding domain-containing protein [Desulfobacterales bacterium]